MKRDGNQHKQAIFQCPTGTEGSRLDNTLGTQLVPMRDFGCQSPRCTTCNYGEFCGPILAIVAASRSAAAKEGCEAIPPPRQYSRHVNPLPVIPPPLAYTTRQPFSSDSDNVNRGTDPQAK